MREHLPQLHHGTVAGDVDTQQRGHLTGHDLHGRTRQVPEHHRTRHEGGEPPQPPREQQQNTGEQRQARGQRHRPVHVRSSTAAHRRVGHDRSGRGGADRHQSGGGEQGEHDGRRHRRVQTDDGMQPGHLPVPEGLRHQGHRDREPGHDVPAHPARRVVPQQPEQRNHVRHRHPTRRHRTSLGSSGALPAARHRVSGQGSSLQPSPPRFGRRSHQTRLKGRP